MMNKHNELECFGNGVCHASRIVEELMFVRATKDEYQPCVDIMPSVHGLHFFVPGD